MRQRMILSILTSILLAFSTGCIFYVNDKSKGPIAPHIAFDAGTGQTAAVSSLVVIWSSGDREVAVQTCLTYVEYAVKNKLFNDTTLVVWGPSANLLANDRELQARIELLIDMGAKVQASADSASFYGISSKLKELGIDVKQIDASLTGILKADNTKVITF